MLRLLCVLSFLYCVMGFQQECEGKPTFTGVFGNETCVPVTVVIHSRSYANEIGWKTEPKSLIEYNAGAIPDFSESQFVYPCIKQGTYAFYMLDSFGDGWNGG